MKKVVALLSSFAMGIALVGCGDAPANKNGISGTKTGTAEGNGGEVSVTITMKDGVITDVKAEGADETPGIGDVALESMPEEMKANNSINVDTVATATITSNAILEAAKAALVELGANPDDYMNSVSAEAGVDLNEEADIVIVGAGGAGMVAAMEASDAGKNVVVVESQPMAGGNSVRATGGMNATGTPQQKAMEFDQAAGVEKTLEKAKNFADNETITKLADEVSKQWADYQANPEGYFDSVELFELDTMVGGHGLNNPELVNVLCSNTKDDIAWLKENNMDLAGVGQFGGASVKRIHFPLNEDGTKTAVGGYLIPKLQENLKERGIKLITDSTIETILTDDNGNVAGVEGTTKDGGKITVNAPVVVLTTGGFGANHEMVESYKPELKGFASTNAAGAQGQGIVMAQKLGAGVVDMEQIQIHPTVHIDADNGAHLITEGLRGDGAILVNQDGKRFTDEVNTRDAVSAAEIAQPGSYAWLVVDTKMANKSAVIGKYIKNGYTVTGETIADLAKATEIDAETLEATLADWNKCVEAKEDAEFGRTAFAETLDEGPFYAIKVTPGIHHTMGGLMINTNAEVLGEDGTTVIPGLFAAGEVTGGVHGGNRLGGNAVADFVVFGRVAGASAAAYEAK